MNSGGINNGNIFILSIFRNIRILIIFKKALDNWFIDNWFIDILHILKDYVVCMYKTCKNI